MFISGDVDLPEPLLEAAQAGRFVVFAGAGVSIAAPSNLPSFDGLVQQVGRGVYPPWDGSNADRRLGLLEDLRVDVQARTREILAADASKPNELHREILRVFKAADRARVVTTNFDQHFTMAARDVYPEPINVHVAPALPLGDDFLGIVHLHGSLGAPGRLVLTDADFGRAYLTRGWATLFLKDMFQRFTVLFIGYSHDDPVMAYLARGLPPGTPRFCFTLPGSDAKWKSFGITPIHYPPKPPPSGHEALPAALAAWAKHARRGALEHEARIRELVAAAPPLDRESIDYLVAALRDPTLIKFFTRHATAADWLTWVDARSALDPLFRRDGGDGEIERELAWWIGRHYVARGASHALALLAKKPSSWNFVLWDAVARSLPGEPRPEPRLLAAWVVLLQLAAPDLRREFQFGLLLEECKFPDELGVAVLCLRWLTDVVFTFEPPIMFDPEKEPPPIGRVRVALRGDPHYLSKSWERMQPHFQELHGELLPLLTSRITECYETLKTCGQANADWDPVSYSRTGIEPHEQDAHREGPSFLVDAARDVVAFLMRTSKEAGRSAVNAWSRAEAPLLRRLALFGMREDPDLDPDEALGAIVAGEWLYAPGLKHEVFRLIEHVFPRASEDVQRWFVAESVTLRVLRREVAPDDEEGQKTIAYGRYNLAVWLAKVAPESKVAREHLQALQAANLRFGPREHPDVNSWTEARWGHGPSPKSSDELRAMNVADLVDFVTTFRSEADREPNRDALLVTFRSSMVADPARSLEVAERLRDTGHWEADVWARLLDGWREAPSEAVPWERLAPLLAQLSLPDKLDLELARALSKGTESGITTEAGLAAAETVADRVFVRAVAEEDEPEDGDIPGGWLTRAINHVGGVVAEIWLRALSRRRRMAEDKWSGLPPAYHERLLGAVAGGSSAAQMARVVVAAHVQFLHSLDGAWTVEHVVPLFDWTRDRRRAGQAWAGFLQWGRLSESVAQAMLPHLEQCFAMTASDLKEHREGLAVRLAGLALYSDIHPLDSGWLTRFVQSADVETRTMWARHVAMELDALETKAKEEAWTRWIQRYWKERATGAPSPFANEETEQMVDWALALGPRLADAVDLLERTSIRPTEHNPLLYTLRDSPLLREEPRTLARLLLHVLKGIDGLSYDAAFVDEATRTLIDAGADREVLVALIERLAELTCPTAAELRRLLDGRGDAARP
ncbi:MAG: DUF4020 domain-containing protein [Planctomycetes bacterium]|nr:DUF4020 domain-containing protein [Planctomycetota bacterium]